MCGEKNEINFQILQEKFLLPAFFQASLQDFARLMHSLCWIFFMDVWNYYASVNYYVFSCSVKIYKRYPLGVSFKEISEGYCSYLKCVLCFLQRIFIPKYHSMQNWRRSYFVNQMIVSYTPMAKMVIQTGIQTISGLLDAVGYRLS